MNCTFKNLPLTLFRDNFGFYLSCQVKIIYTHRMCEAVAPPISQNTWCGDEIFFYSMWEKNNMGWFFLAENFHFGLKHGIFTSSVFYLLTAGALLDLTEPIERKNLKSTPSLIEIEGTFSVFRRILLMLVSDFEFCKSFQSNFNSASRKICLNHSTF